MLALFSISLLISFHWSFQALVATISSQLVFRVAKLFFRFNFNFVNQRKYVSYKYKGVGARVFLYQSISPPDSCSLLI
jgi:hypothetical protein